MGPEHASREKKLSMVIFLNFQNHEKSGVEKKAFFSLFLMRKRLSSGQKWFPRPYFPLNKGMFLLRSGLRFSFRSLEVPEPRVRKRPISLTKRAGILLANMRPEHICIYLTKVFQKVL